MAAFGDLQKYLLGDMKDKFLESISPGWVSNPLFEQVIPLLVSKNPNTTITNIAIQSLISNCSGVNLTSTNQTCDPGFVWDKTGDKCYKVLDVKVNFWRAADTCSMYGADLVWLQNDEQVRGLVQILRSG